MLEDKSIQICGFPIKKCCCGYLSPLLADSSDTMNRGHRLSGNPRSKGSLHPTPFLQILPTVKPSLVSLDVSSLHKHSPESPSAVSVSSIHSIPGLTLCLSCLLGEVDWEPVTGSKGIAAAFLKTQPLLLTLKKCHSEKCIAPSPSVCVLLE